MTTATYRRVIIEGTLTTTSDLHIGTGETGSDPCPESNQSTQFNTLVLDKDKKPYIPGSTLRGLLASQLADGDWKKRWFGDARQRSDADTQGTMGALRVYDAKVNDGFACTFMSRTSIEPVTQTAKQHHLASHQLVQAGASFAVEIAFDYWGDEKNTPISRKDIEQLLGLLARLNGAQLGTGKSVGQGGLTWQQEEISGLSEASFLQWLQKNLEQAGAEPKELDGEYEAIEGLLASTLAGVNDSGWVKQDFALKPLGPILINNPHDVPTKNKSQASKDAKKGEPDLVFLHRGNKAWIPGSTLKGWFRGQCRRILLTLAHANNSKLGKSSSLDKYFYELIDTEVLAALFGGTQIGEGMVRFYDATVTVSDSDKHIQTFNAVDRFTGGVRDGALYNVKGLWVETPFTGYIHYREIVLQGWMKLLLLFAWRDAQEGDLVLGWGKSKGYGRLALQPTTDQWQTWLKSTGELAAWEKSLWNQLDQAVTKAEQMDKEAMK